MGDGLLYLMSNGFQNESDDQLKTVTRDLFNFCRDRSEPLDMVTNEGVRITQSKIRIDKAITSRQQRRPRSNTNRTTEGEGYST